MRINRYLSFYGICSRREADRLIGSGRVKIGERTAVLGDTVSDGDIVSVDDKPVSIDRKEVILAYNKPKGIICTTSDKEHPNLLDAVDYPERVFPIGRLDKDSLGTLLITDDGELAHKMLSPRSHIPKI